MRESVAKVSDALRPTGRVQASAYSRSLAALTGSTKGSLSAKEFGAIGEIYGRGMSIRHTVRKKQCDWTLAKINNRRSRS